MGCLIGEEGKSAISKSEQEQTTMKIECINEKE